MMRHCTQLLGVLCLLALQLLPHAAWADSGTLSITTTLSPSYCKKSGNTLGIRYNNSGFVGATNFQLELSDASGDFTTPTVLGSSPDGSDITMDFNAIAPGGGYKIRIHETNSDNLSSEVGPFSVVTSITLPGISGAINICKASTHVYSNTTNGGTWSSSNAAIVSIDPANGSAKALSYGSATITYSVTNACNVFSTTKSVNVDTAITMLPAIAGADTICIGATAGFSNSLSSGVWSSANNTRATIDAGTGIVAGVATGNVVISYTVSNSCGNYSDTALVNIKSLPYAGILSDAATIHCDHDNTPFNLSVAGSPVGNIRWLTENNSIARVNGATGDITTRAQGWTNILSIASNSCGADTAYFRLRVDPVVEPINGPDTVCKDAIVTFSDTTIGGTWTSSNTARASIDPSSGDTKFFSYGSVTLTYTADRGTCGTANTTLRVFVDTPLSVAIAGATHLCKYETRIQTVNYGNGIWATNDAAVASISGTGSTATLYGVDSGVADIYYQLTNACGTYRDTTTDTVHALPRLGLTDVTLCEHSEVNIAPTNPGGGVGRFSTNIPANFNIDASSGRGHGRIGGRGSITYSYIDSNSCRDSVTANVQVDSVPTIQATPAMNSYFCNGQYTNIQFGDARNRGVSINWTTLGGVLTPFGSAADAYLGGTTDTIPHFTASSTDSSNISSTVLQVILKINATGCVDTAFDTVRVYPTPRVYTVSDAVYCDSDVTAPISLSGPFSGANFTWTFDSSSADIGLGATSGRDSIGSFRVSNNGTDSAIARYTIQANIGSCASLETQNLKIIVRPTPRLSTPLTDSICDNTLYTYLAATASRDSQITWTMTAPAFIRASGFGVDSIYEVIHNDTAYPINLVYHFALNARGCTNNQDMTLKVFPTPRLILPVVQDSICNGTVFNFGAHSYTSGAAFNWTRVTDAENATTYGLDTISDRLFNSSDTARRITYNYSVTANGCLDTTRSVSVAVKPTPRLHTDFNTTQYFCSSPVIPFVFTDSSNTQGSVSWRWMRDSVVHINSRPFPVYWDSRFGILDNTNRSFADTLLSDHYDTVMVKYKFIIAATGCSDTQRLSVLVKPIPVIDVTDTANYKVFSTICSDEVYRNVPTSKTPGITMRWSRAAVDSIFADGLSLSDTGSGQSFHVLKNISVTKPDTVIYIDTLYAYGCLNPQTVRVVVAPQPVLVKRGDSVCSNAKIDFLPVPSFAGTSHRYSWTVTANDENAVLTASGRDRISEIVSTSNALHPVRVAYRFRDTFLINGRQCVSFDADSRNNYTLIIKPQPAKPVITSRNPDPMDSTCQNVQYLNFSNVLPDNYTDPNVIYNWFSTTATIFDGIDPKKYNTLVSVPKDVLTTYVYEQAYAIGYQECVVTDTFTIKTPNTSRKVDSIGVVRFGNNLICNDHSVKNYLWGYEDKRTLTPHVLKQKGTNIDEINQNLYIPDHADFNTDSNYYFVWTINVGNDCRQKSYYNAPVAIFRSVEQAMQPGTFRLSAYPNPARAEVTVLLDNGPVENLEVELYDITGRVQLTKQMQGNIAAVSVDGLADGQYILVCKHNGYKIASTIILKN